MFDRYGYPQVSFSQNCQPKTFRLHRLVARAFLGPPPEGHIVAHNDGNPANAWASNLRYDTMVGNFADKVRHGTRTGGERHSTAKLTQAEVDEIKRLRAAGRLYREIAPLFNVSRHHLGRIVNGKNWNP